MPGVPMEMPSDTVMVLNSTPLPPAASTPATASLASSLMCMLQGVRFAHVDAMPICGLPKSASSKPTARNIARAGDCFAPSTTRRENARTSHQFARFEASIVAGVFIGAAFDSVRSVRSVRARARSWRSWRLWRLWRFRRSAR